MSIHVDRASLAKALDSTVMDARRLCRKLTPLTNVIREHDRVLSVRERLQRVLACRLSRVLSWAIRKCEGAVEYLFGMFGDM